MSFDWIHENPSYWDNRKARVVGGAPAGIFELGDPATGDVMPGEWWRLEEDGTVLGYGWMDTTWGDAEILLAVGDDGRRKGAGTFILDQLEVEAKARGLNYLFNVVRPGHPDRDGITAWLQARGFGASHDDDRLMRKVRR